MIRTLRAEYGIDRYHKYRVRGHVEGIADGVDGTGECSAVSAVGEIVATSVVGIKSTEVRNAHQICRRGGEGYRDARVGGAVTKDVGIV